MNKQCKVSHFLAKFTKFVNNLLRNEGSEKQSIGKYAKYPELPSGSQLETRCFCGPRKQLFQDLVKLE